MDLVLTSALCSLDKTCPDLEEEIQLPLLYLLRATAITSASQAMQILTTSSLQIWRK